MHRNLSQSRSGFTLFEVILALGLSALLMGVLAMLVSVQLRVVDRGRADVEEAQLARALMHRIADDLRNAIHIESAGGGHASSASSDPFAADPDDPNAADPSDPDSSTTEETPSSSAPGLYGSATHLEIDLVPLLRPDEFRRRAEAIGDPTQTVDPPSDMKTIAYFLAEEESALFSSAVDPGLGNTGDSSVRHGLVRRELDRTVTQLALEQSQLQQINNEIEPIAPEVAGIEFRYFDGQEWLEEWDSQQQGGLPTAVEITLSIARRSSRSSMLDSMAPTGLFPGDSEPLIYRLVVRMPTVLPPDPNEAALGDIL